MYLKPGDMVRHKNMAGWTWCVHNTLDNAKNLREVGLRANTELMSNIYKVVSADGEYIYVQHIYDGRIMYGRIQHETLQLHKPDFELIDETGTR
jgi:hypothetical protein